MASPQHKINSVSPVEPDKWSMNSNMTWPYRMDFYLLNTQAMAAVKLSKTKESKSLNDNDAKPETTALI